MDVVRDHLREPGMIGRILMTRKAAPEVSSVLHRSIGQKQTRLKLEAKESAKTFGKTKLGSNNLIMS